MTKKTLAYSLGSALILSGLVFGVFMVMHVRASIIALTTLDGTSLAGANLCSLAGSNVVGANTIDNTKAVTVLVSPDGNIHALSGNYTYATPDCSSLPSSEQAICASISSAYSSAIQQANGISGFPQGSNNNNQPEEGNNTLALVFGEHECGTRNGDATVPLCTVVDQFKDPATGVVSVFATIYFDLGSLNNPAGGSEFTGAQFESNPAFATCTMAHELTHTFGVGDSYILSALNRGLMGHECVPGMAAGNPWDPATTAAIQAINGGQTISISNPVDACEYHCGGNDEIATFVLQASGVFTMECASPTPPALPTSTPSGATCECLNGQILAGCTDPTFSCQETPPTSPSGEPTSTPTGTCECLDGQLLEGCTDPNFVCGQPPSANGGGGINCTCSPNGGQPSCTDDHGNSVDAPSGTVCPASE